METVIETTRTQLINAFQKWNKNSIDNPSEFNEVDDSIECATKQADELLKLL